MSTLDIVEFTAFGPLEMARRWTRRRTVGRVFAMAVAGITLLPWLALLSPITLAVIGFDLARRLWDEG